MYNHSTNSNSRMPNDEQNSGGSNSARIRHVPIRIESRQNRYGDYNTDPNYNRHQSQSAAQQNFYDRAHDTCNENHSSYTLPNNSGNNTSNINISYKPDTPQRPNRPHSSAREQYTRSGGGGRHEQPSSDNQAGSARQHRSAVGDPGKNNKENQESRRGGASESPEKDDNFSEKLVNSPEPIPLPGPSSPEPAEDSGSMQHEQSHDQQQYYQQKQQQEQQQYNQQQSQQQQQQNQQKLQQSSQHQQDATAKPVSDNKKPKKDQDPISAINSIRSEVSKLVQEIANYGGASKDSKEYRYLDEMLTRCLLRLDSIQSSEQDVRQQRKSTVRSIELAADVLSKKAKLNSDMKELFDNLGLNASI